MDLITFDKNKYQKKEQKRVIQKWQDEAAEACKYLIDSKQYTKSIFQKFKQDANVASIALNDCKELGKPFSKYFFKVFIEIKKKR